MSSSPVQPPAVADADLHAALHHRGKTGRAPRTAKEYCENTAAIGELHFAAVTEVQRLLVAHGREFEYRERPEGLDRMKPQMCFRNCTRLLWRELGTGLVYHEGFILYPGFRLPIHHAWLVDENGRVVEPTLPKAGDRLSLCDEDRPTPLETTYFGAGVPDVEGLFRVIRETNTFSILYKEAGHALIEACSTRARAKP